MRYKLIFINLLILQLFVNCFGFGEDKSNGKLDEKSENLLLVDYLNKTNIEFLEINGNWKDNWGSYHQIYAEKNPLSGVHGFWEGLINKIIVEFDNSSKTLYVKGINEPSWADCNNNSTNGENGVECYSRIVWTKYNGSYYYCEIVYNKASLEAAKQDTTQADASNPDSTGCGLYAWTKLQKL
ncbi:MAG: hypothetical protein KatS3mg129_2193 [Leptospiraceae bacterium]|nr:MAG: hypothetical protein KatS3mg129_2193 [Leptospiraceae bacterium]